MYKRYSVVIGQFRLLVTLQVYVHERDRVEWC